MILAGGGGHTHYAYALAQHLEDKCNLEFLIPEEDTLSYERLSRFGKVQEAPIGRGPKTSTVAFARNLPYVLFNAIKNRRQYDRPDVVVSTGSNFSVPPSLVAWFKRKHIVNIESAVRLVSPSSACKYLAPLSSVTALQWEEQKRFFPRGELFGPLLTNKETEPHDGGYILVTGGTYGHKRLFEVLDTTSLENIFLQTASENKGYSKRHPTWRVIKYSSRFYEIVAGASIIITHLGDTILESALYGKPTIAVINPDWTRTGTYADALEMAKKINFIVLNGKELSAETLLASIEQVRDIRPKRLRSGTEPLSKRILELAG